MKLFESVWMICALTGAVCQGTRLSGGRFIKIEDAPYQVLIKVRRVDKCGGSLISPGVVVTAAHCFSNGKSISFEPSEVLVLAGSSNKLRMQQSSKAAHLKVHEDYNKDDYGISQENDIALVKLKNKLTINNRVKTIILRSHPTKSGSECFVSGWAAEIHGRRVTETANLKGAAVVTRPFDECNATYSIHVGPLHPDVICAGVPKGVNEVCLGDSGGPLVCDDTLAGLLSFDQNCFDPSSPEVYTDIFKYRSWILANGYSKLPPLPLISFIFPVFSLYLLF